MAFSFEKLEVYQKAISFADHTCQATEGFGRGYGFLSDQLNRAALSVAANIAEGNGRFTKPDRKNFLASRAGRCKSASRFWNWRGDENCWTTPATMR